MRAWARAISNARPTDRRTHDIACNWKIYVENYLEGYHIPIVHPALSEAVDAAKYEVAVEGGCASTRAAESAGGERVYDGLWAFVRPHLGINVYGHGLMMERMVPTGLNSTRLDLRLLFRPEIAADPAERQRILPCRAS